MSERPTKEQLQKQFIQGHVERVGRVCAELKQELELLGYPGKSLSRCLEDFLIEHPEYDIEKAP